MQYDRIEYFSGCFLTWCFLCKHWDIFQPLLNWICSDLDFPAVVIAGPVTERENFFWSETLSTNLNFVATTVLARSLKVPSNLKHQERFTLKWTAAIRITPLSFTLKYKNELLETLKFISINVWIISLKKLRWKLQWTKNAPVFKTGLTPSPDWHIGMFYAPGHTCTSILRWVGQSWRELEVVNQDKPSSIYFPAFDPI